MPKIYLVAAALFAGLAVAAGAFAAHGLKSLTTDEKVLGPFHTAAQYQMYHALALLLVGAMIDRLSQGTAGYAGFLFMGGIVLFSGSLYFISSLKAMNKVVPTAIGIMTPIGGMLFIAGWLLLLIAIIRK